jgi:hypothetical protein
MRLEEVQEIIEAKGGSIETFFKWMRGQTIGLYDDGTSNFYEYDVERFIRYGCNPDNEPLSEWD